MERTNRSQDFQLGYMTAVNQILTSLIEEVASTNASSNEGQRSSAQTVKRGSSIKGRRGRPARSSIN